MAHPPSYIWYVWLLSCAAGWAIGSGKGRPTAGLLWGLFGVLGLIVIACQPSKLAGVGNRGRVIYALDDPRPYGVGALVREAAVALVLALAASGVVIYERTSWSGTTRVVRVAPGPAKRTFATVDEAQQEAIRRYPLLGVKGSDFNRQFVARYNAYLHEKPGFFRNPGWPVQLAEEVGALPTGRVRVEPGGS